MADSLAPPAENTPEASTPAATPASPNPSNPLFDIPEIPGDKPETSDTPSSGGTPAEEGKTGLEEFSKKTGLDFSGFPSVEAAEAAYKMQVNNWAHLGNLQQQVPQQPVQQPAPVNDDFDEPDAAEEEDVLPEVPKPNKRQTKREKALEKRLQQLERREQERELRIQQQHNARTVSETVQAIDNLNAPQLGTTGARNAIQHGAASSVARLAWSIQQGAALNGMNITTQQAVAAAAAQAGIDVNGAPKREEQTSVPQPEPRSSSGALPPGGQPFVPVHTEERLGGFVSMINDPEFRAAAARIGK